MNAVETKELKVLASEPACGCGCGCGSAPESEEQQLDRATPTR